MMTNDSCQTSPTLICSKHAHLKPCVAANITDLHSEISPHKTDERHLLPSERLTIDRTYYTPQI